MSSNHRTYSRIEHISVGVGLVPTLKEPMPVGVGLVPTPLYQG